MSKDNAGVASASSSNVRQCIQMSVHATMRKFPDVDVGFGTGSAAAGSLSLPTGDRRRVSGDRKLGSGDASGL